MVELAEYLCAFYIIKVDSSWINLKRIFFVIWLADVNNE